MKSIILSPIMPLFTLVRVIIKKYPNRNSYNQNQYRNYY